MFVKEFEKFKITIEKHIEKFFNCTPEQALEMEAALEEKYWNKYVLTEVQFQNVNPDDRDDVLKYKTLRYFNSIYIKTLQLEKALKGAEDEWTGICYNKAED